MCRTASRMTANAGIAATTAPNPTRLAIVKIGNTEEFAPASTLSRSLQKSPEIDRDHGDVGSSEGNKNSPHTDRRADVDAPRFTLEKGKVYTRKNDQGHQKVDDDNHNERQDGQDERRIVVTAFAMVKLRRVEITGCGSLFADLFSDDDTFGILNI